MPLTLTSAQSPVTVYPGQQFKLFDGTETVAALLKSVTVQLGKERPASPPSQQLFTVTFASAPTATVLIQGSNDDVDGHYQTLATLTTITGYYADLGEFAYYRAYLSVYSAGGMPTVLLQR